MLLRCISSCARSSLKIRHLEKTKSFSLSASIDPSPLKRPILTYSQQIFIRRLIHSNYDRTKPLDLQTYDHICSETLESLTEFFEQAVEDCPHLKDPDVTFGDGVLSIHFGPPYGSYVINRQRPNLQIWLSSPTSGPKRYDFIDGRWIYKHDGVCLHDLLEKETSEILKRPVDLSNCTFYKI
ncbi:frataxin homolog, mitochondrial [Neocloeon triangulifer]|uniref:frataxin homolog, mitochondrial n=1 Tax=Neocloeon triangulifer TaxID=2078957 RepID=UPI00286F70E1|nr:frataxin homolog, mitochondrial [Neocloeon triangulifer]XP_059470697.1 frataxin homolog, mitochondrial [Neocloeon triangulifer]